MKVPLTKPSFSEAEIEAVREVLRSGWVTQGPKVAIFESLLRTYLRAKEIVVVSNCTVGLHLCLLVSGIGPGDEVIVPSLTYIATVNSIKYVGAVPVFTDISLSTYNIDPKVIENNISKRTKAILVVHQIGLASDLDPIRSLAKKYNLSLIEDAAPALGATYKKEMIGEKGLLVAFSLHPRKSITTGEGGIIATTDRRLAQRLRALRSHGSSKSDFARHANAIMEFEEFRELGYNYRLSDIQAAIGIVQLKKLPSFINCRRKLAKTYMKSLKGVKRIILPVEPDYARHTFQSFQVRIEGLSDRGRDRLLGWLLEQGIVTRRGVMASHFEPLYKDLYKVDLPNTEKAFHESVLLPLFPGMTEKQQEYVIQKLTTGVKKMR